MRNSLLRIGWRDEASVPRLCHDFMLTEIIIEAWTALRRNYTRSFLTMLGIVWGIATVTLLIAYGSSFRQILVMDSMRLARA